MRIFTPLLFTALLAFNHLNAEGTREVAPNGSIVVNGNNTTDIAALHINNPAYNNFAAFDNPDPLSRLYIHIKDPATECIYLGFNWAHNNVNSNKPPRLNFQYRIKDPNGNVVYGPITVTPGEANIQTWSEAVSGPLQIVGPSGYNATEVSSGVLGSQGWSGKGDYYIEFRDDENNDLLIDFWDITVADCSAPAPVAKNGRVWSFNWSFFAINDYGFPNRPFNGAFFVCAPDPDNISASFVTKIDFNQSDFRPAAFNVAFNSFGSMNTGDIASDRRSVENINATQAEYAIFLNDPIDICETATVGEISLLGVSRCAAGAYCVKFISTKEGQIDLLLDFDGQDNVYTPGTADVLISHLVTAEEVGVSSCISWDGNDGFGNPLPEFAGTQIPVTIAYAQGIYHFPIYDAEFMTNGFMISSVRPAAAVSLLFYDDSNISVPSGSGEPSIQLTGCMPPCHRWTNYTQPNTPGFGNLHTINSWWFSQLLIRQDVFFLPGYYTCDIQGPLRFCSGTTAELTSNTALFPAGAEELNIVSTVWTGPGIVGANTGSSITIDDGGNYLLRVTWINGLGDTCETACDFQVFLDPPTTATIDTLMVQGQTIVINDQTYSEGGTYVQELTTAEGCDSILTINIVTLNTVIHYDLNDCQSYMSNNSHMDYSEFVPFYPQPLGCATIIADTLHRENPAVNKHSCTPGVNDSPGMCVGTLAGCNYIAGHEASVIIELNIVPDADTAVHLTGFSFYEKAPTDFVWIDGPTGANNYPTLFRVRVLKNGVEIYLSPETPTSLTWNQNVYDFLDNDDFLVKDPTTFRFELLSYCPVGNGAVESVWDLDEIDIVASCAPVSGLNRSVSGLVSTEAGILVPDVQIFLYDDPTFTNFTNTTTSNAGTYTFESVVPETGYFIRGYRNVDHTNGVTTYDLVQIQRHLLGIKLFTSPYQYIAADANRSNSVSAIDLLELRKLLLGKYDSLPRNTSWRFGDAGQALEVTYPWAFSETIAIEYLTDHITDADFVAVKVGDVTGDVQIDLQSDKVTPRTSDRLILKTDNKLIKAGEVMTIDITAENFTNIAGIQLGLDVQAGSILDVIAGALPITEEHFNITADGQLLMSWNGTELTTLSADKVLFSIVVLSDVKGMSGEQLSIQDGKLNAEAYVGDDYNLFSIELASQNQEAVVYQNALFGNEPNPFAESTIIRFALEKDAPVIFTYYNLSGQLLFTQEGDFTKGSHEMQLDARHLKGSEGLILCRMQTDGFVATQKIIAVR